MAYLKRGNSVVQGALNYEEGSWTPTFGTGIASANCDGRYRKIGRFVFISATLAEIGCTSTSSVEGVIGGLPFTPAFAADFTVGYVYQIELPANAVALGVRVIASADIIYMQWSRDHLATVGAIGSQFDHASAQINFTGCYVI